MTTSQTTSRYAFGFVFAITMTAMLVVAGSVGARNGQQGAMQAAPIDVTALMISATDMPVLQIENPL